MELETEERRKRMKLTTGFEVPQFPFVQKLPSITEMMGVSNTVKLPWMLCVPTTPMPTTTAPEAFICATCQIPLEKPHFRDGKVYCQKDYALQLHSFPAGMPLSHPENHQIANYNVYPAPVIALAKGLGATETMTAFLVEGSSNYELQEGFQSGQVRVIKEGGNYLVFNGLKINKMGSVKKELRQHQIMKFDFFVIRFRMAGYSWDSRPFRLVSSCTQLPKEVRSRVRPSKRAPPPGSQTNEFENTEYPEQSQLTTSTNSTNSKGPASIQYLVD